ncbi:MAG: M48 family metalloprotease [Chloroflexota bacterium]
MSDSAAALAPGQPEYSNAPASRRDQARALARTRRRLFVISTSLGILAPWAVWTSGLAAALWAWAATLPPWLGLPLYLAEMTLLLMLVGTPLAFYRGYVIGHRYQLSTQPLSGWLVDWLKTTLLGLALGTAAATALYVTIWHAPSIWWLAFWVEAIFAMMLVTFVAPYVILPLFFKPRPVGDPGLVMIIEELVQRAGTTVAGISRLDFSRRTHEANAAVIGFGRSRRVVLADTLLDSFPASEIRAVVAHELGHHVHRDVIWLLVTQGVVMLVGLAVLGTMGDPVFALLGIGSVTDPATFPVLIAAASIYGLLTLPGINALSRRVEARADTYGHRLLGDGRPFAAAMRRLADQNLAEERPPRWAELLLYMHPPIWRRVALAEAAPHG